MPCWNTPNFVSLIPAFNTILGETTLQLLGEWENSIVVAAEGKKSNPVKKMEKFQIRISILYQAPVCIHYENKPGILLWDMKLA
jgi:hypothetical protein